MKRIVITGMGLVSPLGCGTEAVWQSLLAGKSGISALPAEMVQDIACKVAGQVPTLEQDAQHGFNPDGIIAAKDRKKMDRFIEFALVAAHEALTQANWFPQDNAQQQRTATVIATGIGGFNEIANAVETTAERGPRRLSPFTIPSFLANLAAGHVSIAHGFRGPIGDAARLIRSGEADIALCGGTEAAIHRVSLAGFAAAKAMSGGFNDRPEQASRPFDRDRDGFVMGEGAGLLVIESLEHAEARGATPLAELVGYGTSADAYHLTAGPENGEGARRAMETALAQAGISAREVQHINAHATSTPVGDKGELAAIGSLFAGSKVAITSTKSATGHLLGAAGGVEAIFSILALRDQVAPPTLNLQHPDEAAVGLNLVALKPQPTAMTYALSNGFGFGGVNASLLFKAWQ